MKNIIKHGIEIENLDQTNSPKENFYEYACGGWKKNNPLTAEFSNFGTFNKIYENARLQLKGLVTGLAADPSSKEKDSIAQKVNDLYNMGMDMDRLNREGAEPLLPYLKKIESSERKDIASTLSWLHNGMTSSFFGTGVGPDPIDSDTYTLHLVEAGLGLGDRDYYLEKSDENNRILSAYERYVKRLMELCGYSPEEQQRVWENVISLETEFARHKMTREEKRDPRLRYNPRTLEQVKTDYPNFDWDTYLNGIGLNNVENLNVMSTGFADFFNEWIGKADDRALKDYMLYDLISSSSGLMSEDFVDANFEMFGKVMSGKEEKEPRWKKAMSIPNSMLGEAVGELYVKKYFPEENKAYMLELVEHLRNALSKHISELSWMSDTTKIKALEKLKTLTVKIGYPDKWKDYSEIHIDPSKSYLENVLAASLWFTQDNYSKLGKKVDKTEWHMTPQTVNAYYSPSSNEICFPAGILQPPYFDVTADDAQNYGAIGVVIGHEMTHGFDDSGRQFDKDGNLAEWWTKEDADRFNTLAEKLVDQFNEVEVAPGVHANGKFTLGENIADQGGLRVALTAYLDKTKDELPVDIDGFSPLQRFYLAYANVWASNIRDEEILLRTKTDPHSLAVNRVNVTLKNIQPFFETFDIKEGDKMYRPDNERVIIW